MWVTTNEIKQVGCPERTQNEAPRVHLKGGIMDLHGSFSPSSLFLLSATHMHVLMCMMFFPPLHTAS